MIDVETHSSLEVRTEGDAGPFLMVPLTQLAELTEVLKRNGIAHSIAPDAISWDDEPFIAIVNFGNNIDPKHLQGVLDSA